MKKEVFLAVFVGFILGLIITFGIWTANKSLKNQPAPLTQTPPENTSPTPIPPSNNQLSLNVDSPEDESISSTSSVSLSGKTSPRLPVVITWETGQTIAVADDTGVFEADIKLEGGYNRINLAVYDNQGNSATKDLLVTYTTSKI